MKAVQWTYTAAVRQLFALPSFTEKNPPKHTGEVLRRLGIIETDRKVIHVAGTVGKGSTCCFLEALLLAEKKSVGTFVSPHLRTVKERIRVGGQMISDEEFVNAFQRVWEIGECMVSEGLQRPAFFETLFAMAMYHFQQKKVEYAIIETGLGGKMDATNCLRKKELCIITAVGLDHTKILGETVGKIAQDKAGILREGVPVLCDGSQKEAVEVIEEVAGKLGANCQTVTNSAYQTEKITKEAIAFSMRSRYDGRERKWQIKGGALYQQSNATLALTAMDLLFRESNRDFSKEYKALQQLQISGRYEKAAEGLFLDGAHNVPGMRAFLGSLPKKRTRRMVIFSALRDKDYEGMIHLLVKYSKADRYLVTAFDDERLLDSKQMEEAFRKEGVIPRLTKELSEALAEGFLEIQQGSEVYVVGSLHLVGAVLEMLQGGNDV